MRSRKRPVVKQSVVAPRHSSVNLTGVVLAIVAIALISFVIDEYDKINHSTNSVTGDESSDRQLFDNEEGISSAFSTPKDFNYAVQFKSNLIAIMLVVLIWMLSAFIKWRYLTPKRNGWKN